MSASLAPSAAKWAATPSGRRARRSQLVAFVALGASALAIVVLAVLFVGVVVVRGAPAINWEFLTAMPRDNMRAGGIMPVIVGSLYLVVVTMAMAMPVGVLAAVYLSEYARKGLLVRTIRVAILNLAGVPSIVYGLFGMGLFVMVIVPKVLQLTGDGGESGKSACLLAAAATMAVLVLPLVVATTEEALRQVPQGLRAASLALGATRWQTIWRVVLPNALPGILTGLMLAVGRAAGETAPILLTGAFFWMSHLPRPAEALFQPFMALPFHLFTVSTQMPDAPEQLRWGTALVLIAMVVGANSVGIALRSWLRRRKRV